VLDAIRSTRVALKGPITTPVGTGFRSVNVALRTELDLFASVRPARTLPGIATRHPNVDIVTVRENTEDVYRGVEFERGSVELTHLRERLRELAGFELREDAGVTVKPISVAATKRVVATRSTSPVGTGGRRSRSATRRTSCGSPTACGRRPLPKRRPTSSTSPTRSSRSTSSRCAW
jgi:hypothetical protein